MLPGCARIGGREPVTSRWTRSRGGPFDHLLRPGTIGTCWIAMSADLRLVQPDVRVARPGDAARRMAVTPPARPFR